MKKINDGSNAPEMRCNANLKGNRHRFSRGHIAAALISLALFGCGGDNDGAATGSAATQSSSATGTAQTGGSNGDAKRTMSTTDTNSAASILNKMGKIGRVQIGLGSGQSIDDMKAQGIRPDIVDYYLVGVGSGAWPSWNSPTGAYVTYKAQAAIDYGATPMFTLYGMAQRGDSNLSGINDPSFMGDYWSQARTLFDRINDLNTAVLVNLEPDFWPYVYAQAPNHDATQMPAVLNNQPECSWMANNAANIGSCLVSMARWHAPKALIGFPPAFWNATPDVSAKYMQLVGADRADFIVAQTSDRDAGCLEVAAVDECKGRTGPFYLDANNVNTPNFHQQQNSYSAYRDALGNGLPILWWQTPLGVASDTPGGTPGHYRDNHVDYMLRNTWEYGGMHTFAIVFGGGGTYSTNINTDGGQFARLFGQYLTSGGVAAL